MCGLVGCFGRYVNYEWVHGQLAGLSHRGPDSHFAIEVSNECILGAARLAMTDKSHSGNQPFSLNDDWLVFNGEIYNYKALKELLFASHKFKSQSDTEVLGKVLQNLIELDLGILNGPFAFAFYRASSRELLLGRDDSGKKPLFFRVKHESIYFSSITSQLTSNMSAYDSAAMIQVLRLGYVLDPHSIFSDVKAISPGTLMTFQISGSTILQSQRKILEEPQSTITSRGLIPLRREILNAVERRVDGHDQVALSLSGGLDSTVLSVCLRILKKTTFAYSVVWPDSDKERYNLDSQLAAGVARANGQNFEFVPMSAAVDIPRILDKYIELMGEPNCNPSGLSMMKLYEKAKLDGHRLMLTGDGADELFYGYDRYRLINKFSKFARFSHLFNLPPFNNFRWARTFSATQLEDFNGWAYWHQTFTMDEIAELFNFSSDEIMAVDNMFKSEWSEFFSSELNKSQLMMGLDRKIWLSMESNRRLDRVSMHYSIEARSPFQDKDLRKLAYDIQLNQKIENNIGKKQLVSAFPELAQLKLLNRKMGFISPLGHWIRMNSPFIEQNLDYLATTGFTRFQFHRLGSTIDGLKSGDFLTLRKIWTLLVIARWLQKESHAGL